MSDSSSRQLIVTFAIAGILCTGLLQVVYWLELRPQAIQLLEGEVVSNWFRQIVNWWYPRLIVETQRLPPSFFLAKADQVIGRVSLFFIVVSMALVASTYRTIQHRWTGFWSSDVKRIPLQYGLRIFYAGIFLFTKDWFFYLQDYAELSAFYKPISFYNLLNLGFPSINMLRVLWAMYVCATVCVVLWIRPVWSTSVASILFLYLQGFLYSFEKINHAFATSSYVCMLLPLLTYQLTKASKTASTWINGWLLRLIQVSVATAYLQSGLEKVLNSGFFWFDQQTLLLNYEIVINDYLPSNLAKVATMGVLFFQISFIFMVWHSTTRWIYLCIGITFHVATVHYMNVGALLTPWVFVYLFWFFPEKKK